MAALLESWARRAVLSRLARLERGRLIVETPTDTLTFGDPAAPAVVLRVHTPRFFTRVVLEGEMGLGEGYVDGDWSAPDLVALIRLMLANAGLQDPAPSALAWLARLRELGAHRWRDNTPAGSRRNIRAHYDLSNDFFELFLDSRLQYSCAVFEQPDDTLETAQLNKLDAICRKLDLRPADRLLEIGSGWGGLAFHAASRYGCHVTTTTISAEQHAYVATRLARNEPGASRIDLRFEDYRDLRGRFDKIVSVEMFEAVGLRHYDAYFAACNRLLGPGGVMLLQTITVDDWRFRDYRRAPSWIAKHVFPGGELASVAEILASLARVSRLGLFHVQQIGPHYATTLRHWRQRFHRRLDEVRALGFDARFIRMWDLYLAYCEAAFTEHHVGDVQLVLAKSGSRPAWRDDRLETAPVRIAARPAPGAAASRHAEPAERLPHARSAPSP